MIQASVEVTRDDVRQAFGLCIAGGRRSRCCLVAVAITRATDKLSYVDGMSWGLIAKADEDSTYFYRKLPQEVRSLVFAFDNQMEGKRENFTYPNCMEPWKEGEAEEFLAKMEIKLPQTFQIEYPEKVRHHLNGPNATWCGLDSRQVAYKELTAYYESTECEVCRVRYRYNHATIISVAFNANP